MYTRMFTRNFIVLLLGQAFSLIGNYSLKFALSMYVLEQTGSAGVFGTILAAAVVPTVLLSPLGGVLADRINRRTLMMVLDGISGVSVCLTFFLLDRIPGLSLVVILQIVLGILAAFESPTVQACIPQMQSGANLIKANAIVNEIQAVAALVTPFVGSLLYAAWGIRPVLVVVALCFWGTVWLEYFIVLPNPPKVIAQNVWQIVRTDLIQGVRFLGKEQPAVLQLLLLASLANFFTSGCITVGLPFLVRTTLGLSATWYGVAESVMGAAAIFSGLLVGGFGNHLKTTRMYWFLAGFGISLLVVGAAFLADLSPTRCFVILVTAIGAAEILCGIFSVMGLSLIQQRTPERMTGKIMAFVMSVAMCAQPLGQLFYGVAFDMVPVWWNLLGTGVMVLVISFASRPLFEQLGKG